MGFSRQERWSGLPLPPPGDFPDPGIESRSPALQADALMSEPPGKPILLWPKVNPAISLVSGTSPVWPVLCPTLQKPSVGRRCPACVSLEHPHS